MLYALLLRALKEVYVLKCFDFNSLVLSREPTWTNTIYVHVHYLLALYRSCLQQLQIQGIFDETYLGKA